MSESRRALLTFAFVSEALKTHHDIVVGLAPLFNPIASDLSGQIFAPERLKEELSTRYGLSITADIAEYVAFSLHRAGLLKRREVGSADQTFLWSAPPHSTINAAQDFDQKIEHLAKRALEFAEHHRSLLTWDMDNDHALNMMFDWIIEQDRELSEAELLRHRGTEETFGTSQRRLRSEQQYFCSRFTEWLRKADPELFDFLSDVGNAVMISEVIMELRSPTFSPSQRGDLYAYLDAPLCMEILDCCGKARKDDSDYLIGRLKHFGAVVAIFAHSLEEMKQNVRAVLNNRPGDRTGPTAAALLKREVTEDYLWGVLRNTDQLLKDAGIEVYDIDRAPLPVSNVQAFPDSYENGLLSQLQQNYKRFEAAERDARSAMIVMRRRGRHRSSDLFRVKHVMITRNPMVSTITRRFCENERLIESNQFGPIIHARQAAALIWFAVGAEQKQEISRRQLVLNCSKAIETAPNIIEQLRRKLKEIKPENVEMFDVLIREPRNLQVAMDFAYGSEGRAIETDPDAILAKLTETLTKEEKEKYQSELRKVKSQHRTELAQRTASEDALRTEITGLKAAETRRREQQLDLVELTFHGFSTRCRRAIVAVKWLFAVVLFSLTSVTSSILLGPLDDAWVHGWTLALSGIVGLIVAIAVFFDPVNLVEKGVRAFFARRFSNELSKRELSDIAKLITVDWHEYTITIAPLLPDELMSERMRG